MCIAFLCFMSILHIFFFKSEQNTENTFFRLTLK